MKSTLKGTMQVVVNLALLCILGVALLVVSAYSYGKRNLLRRYNTCQIQE